VASVNADSWYLPHHPVLNPTKPGKVRIVFDCAAQYMGHSLNSELLSGPNLTNDLTGVLLRFRKFPIAICADIEEMFLQVNVPLEDRKALSFLWWPNDNLEGEPSVYHMNVHPFGATSSPFCATFALRRAASDNSAGPEDECVNTVLDNFYVDDCLVSVDTVEEGINLASMLKKRLFDGGFRLLKWNSNSAEVLNTLPVYERSNFGTVVSCSKEPDQSTLGLRWSTLGDSFKLTLNLPTKPPTRRGILSCVSSLYDPLGFSAPMTLHARQLLQELCNNAIGWDSVLTDEYVNRWEQWLEDIQSVTGLNIPRHVGLSKRNVDTVQVHVFCDASDVGYGAVGYLRVTTNGHTSCHFLMGKSRVAPKKVATVPRMELVAAVLAVKLTRHLVKELKYSVSSAFIWTDSMIVLYYLKNTSSRFTTFVANRVRYILENSSEYYWKHVPSELNPADVASRGARTLQARGMKLWLKGPEFLSHDETEWPVGQPLVLETTENIEVKSALLASTPRWHCLWFSRYSSWNKLLKAVSWMIRFKEYFMIMKGRRVTGSLRLGELNIHEIRLARLNVLRLVQEECFDPQRGSNDFGTLKCLNPVKIDGLLCVGGRLQQSYCVAQRHPIILPARHHVTDLIIRSVHETNGHVGRVQVLANIRRRYWIIKGMAQVKRVVGKCPKCKLLYASPVQQIMSPLPSERVNVGSRPFRYCGVDYFGPFKVRLGRSEHKRYGCLFTCMQTRAVHIEISHSLTTDSFILALMRFINRRGSPEMILSDNGSNFIGAEKELADKWRALDQKIINSRLCDKNIDWQFNPAGASHRGGIWERIIRSIRRVLAAVTIEQVLSDETVSTAMTEVERIINDRPLVPLYDDPQSPSVLRPSDLLILGDNDEVLLDNDVNIGEQYKRSWRQAQLVASTFWKRWVKEYLPMLQCRHKWAKVQRDVRKGDLVLLVDTAAPRAMWRKGLVTDVYAGQDGHVRRAAVKTAGGSLLKDIRSICLLEGNDE